ncbi:hypothetical protein YP76_22325 [Sphingobium chungbukense]|uniref:Uncharacterized protein n=1 Tax=Sphingobium chungbukense TaxID=56193 RepID=A0A0M3AJY6_9SPHN|nr:hypothetical protein YP76_22325 [Sphingobium chungbukense]
MGLALALMAATGCAPGAAPSASWQFATAEIHATADGAFVIRTFDDPAPNLVEGPDRIDREAGAVRHSRIGSHIWIDAALQDKISTETMK